MKCLICGNSDLIKTNTLISSFIANRIDLPSRWIIRLLVCRSCDFRWFDYRFSEDQIKKIYKNYRDEQYLSERSASEWFYTPSFHQHIINNEHSIKRAEKLATQLKEMTHAVTFGTLLDYGGENGHLIRFVAADEKFVFDISGVKPMENMFSINKIDQSHLDFFDCIVCAQTLEHCTEPVEEFRRIISLLKPGGYIYLELPDENIAINPTGKITGYIQDFIISRCVKYDFFMKLMDSLFTASRILFKALPSFAIIPMREHINYFSLKSMHKLLEQHDIEVIKSENFHWVFGKKHNH